MRTLPDKITELTLPSGAIVEVDGNGYLTNPDQWTPEFTEFMADQENISLTPQHHEVLDFIRASEAEHRVMPDVRFVLKLLAQKDNLNKSGSKAALFDLFPYGYVGQACKMAGMRQPRAWSTG